MSLIHEVIAIRKQKGLSQEEVASRIPIAQNTLSQYENEKRPLTIEMFLLLLKAMDTEFVYSFQNQNGEQKEVSSMAMNEMKIGIDFRAIRTEEGFRLWALEQERDKIRVDMDGDNFVVYQENENGEFDGATFWLVTGEDGFFSKYKLLSICEDEGIPFEEL
ncbi:helix-turn-helix transcriptional regulator (plasmid) [Pontibacillus sp. ALD_SL1]|uniref:helix-turn-helix domain-containing protein n=1 Tax=Pontibacillus sp. ALD_SL1 TaxID=2777185 RepID=UPI001A95665D|nr:helix-turn-helix transcriptional regulator [Pontibacillus sp. ALD_SL1]QST02153.1 helix-turn-helix transcriptional regulator [Pontibacillus sp. ALD_SL1]